MNQVDVTAPLDKRIKIIGVTSMIFLAIPIIYTKYAGCTDSESFYIVGMGALTFIAWNALGMVKDMLFGNDDHYEAIEVVDTEYTEGGYTWDTTANEVKELPSVTNNYYQISQEAGLNAEQMANLALLADKVGQANQAQVQHQAQLRLGR